MKVIKMPSPLLLRAAFLVGLVSSFQLNRNARLSHGSMGSPNDENQTPPTSFWRQENLRYSTRGDEGEGMKMEGIHPATSTMTSKGSMISESKRREYEFVANQDPEWYNQFVLGLLKEETIAELGLLPPPTTTIATSGIVSDDDDDDEVTITTKSDKNDDKSSGNTTKDAEILMMMKASQNANATMGLTQDTSEESAQTATSMSASPDDSLNGNHATHQSTKEPKPSMESTNDDDTTTIKSTEKKQQVPFSNARNTSAAPTTKGNVSNNTAITNATAPKQDEELAPPSPQELELPKPQLQQPTNLFFIKDDDSEETVVAMKNTSASSSNNNGNTMPTTNTQAFNNAIGTTPLDDDGDEVILYFDIARQGLRLTSLATLTNLGYSKQDLDGLRADIAASIMMSQTPRPTRGIPAKWKADSQKKGVKVIQLLPRVEAEALLAEDELKQAPRITTTTTRERRSVMNGSREKRAFHPDPRPKSIYSVQRNSNGVPSVGEELQRLNASDPPTPRFWMDMNEIGRRLFGDD